MKIGMGTLLLVLLLCAIVFLGSVAGSYIFLIQPHLKEMKGSVTGPQIPPVPGMEFAGPPIIKPKTTEVLSKTAAELDEWSKDLEIWKQKNLALDDDLRRREELLRNERAAITVERERVLELQNRLEEFLVKTRQEASDKQNKSMVANKEYAQEQAQLYSLMKPEENVEMLRLLPDDQVARIMSLTKPKRQAKLIEIWLQQYKEDQTRLIRIQEAMRDQRAEEKTASTTQ